MTDTIYYAIGDIHGEADKLAILHGRIARRHALDFPGRQYVLVHLGDYIDRGPDSYEVVEMLIGIENAGLQQVINLKGNHEQRIFAYYKNNDFKSYRAWMEYGGRQTLESYRRAGFDEPPVHHLDWMGSLKSFHWDKAAKLIFVHAGIDPINFPNDGEDRHLWTRSSSFFDTKCWDNPVLSGVTLVHGHTITDSGKPDVDGDYLRINIDTGACFGGDLTAVILVDGKTPEFLSVS
jgi:serine/threonine protein phosphatase 1